MLYTVLLHILCAYDLLLSASYIHKSWPEGKFACHLLSQQLYRPAVYCDKPSGVQHIDRQVTEFIRSWLSQASVLMDAPLTRKATQLPVRRCSVFRPLAPVIHNLRDARVEDADWMQMYKWNMLHNKAFMMNGCALNAHLMMPSEELQYMTECV